MKGHGNHRVMQDAEGIYVGKAILKNKDLFFAYGRGSFPAVVDGDGEVYGEVYWIRDKKTKSGVTPLEILDRLEGYNVNRPNAQNMYIRKRAKAKLENGKEVWVSYYYWNRPVNPSLKICSGKYEGY